MARLIIENITLAQAKALAHWYEGQGEQNADDWLSEHQLQAPLVDVSREDWLKIEGDEVTVYCKSDSPPKCQRCDTPLTNGYCDDETCPFSDHQQTCPVGWHGHPQYHSEESCTCNKESK